MDGTYVADIVIDNSVEKELRTIWDGLPCSQGADVLLPVFNLRRRGYNEVSIVMYKYSKMCLQAIKMWLLTSLISSVTLRW